MKRIQRAFTLIELMIVVAIIGILAAIALPAYQDYVIRARVSEAIGKLGEMKTTIAEYAASSSDMPADAATAGIDTGSFGTYVSATSLTRNSATSATISVTLQSFNVTALDGNDITFNCTRSSTTNVTTCTCSVDATTMYRYVPANCRNTS